MVKLNVPKFVSQTSSVSSLVKAGAEASPVLDTRGCFSGWLNKKSHNKMVANTFQKRFFVLSNDSLSYTKHPDALEVVGELTEHPLIELEWVTLRGKEGNCKEFEVSFKSRSLLLVAPDSNSAQQWVSRIEQAARTAKGQDQRSSSGANRTSSMINKGEAREETSPARHGRHSGWLKKKTHNKVIANSFQKRFFVLSNDALSYAKKPEAVDVEGELTEHPLSELEWVRLCGKEDVCTDFEASFKSRVLHLEASDSTSAREWVSHIQQAAQAAKGEDQRESSSGAKPPSSNASKEEALKEMISTRGGRFSGWLSKKTHNKMVKNSFQKRLFILTNDALLYAKQPLAGESELTEHPLSELEWVKSCGESGDSREFEVSFKSRVLHLKAPDSASAREWVTQIDQATLSPKGEDQSSTFGPDPSSSPTSPVAVSKEEGIKESKQDVTLFQADAMQQSENEVAKLGRKEKAEADAGSSEDGSSQAPLLPPHASRRHSIYRSLNEGLDLDLDGGPQQQEDEALQQQEHHHHRPPSPRSMLANPARFSSMATQSPRQQSSTKQGLHQPSEQSSVRSSARPSDSDGEVGSGHVPEPPTQPHHRLGHTNPLFVSTQPSSCSEHQRGALASAAFSPRTLASQPSSLLNIEGLPRPTSALNRSLQGPLRPRLLQPDAPLPEASPRPGLHHAIALQKAHNSRGNSAQSREGTGEDSKRLELDGPSAHDGRAQKESMKGSRGINQAKRSDPESETLVLGPNVQNGRAATAADAVTERAGSRNSTAHVSLQSSMQSSMGSARNAAPRLLSGAAASRAPPPPQLDERIELPPPNYPEHPPIPRPLPSTAESRQRSAADHQGGGDIDRTELEENWDSDEEEQEPTSKQHQQKMPTQDAKAHSRVPHSQQQPQQQQGMESHNPRVTGNSWDDDDDDANNTGSVQQVQPKPPVPAPPQSGRSRPARPVPPPAAPRNSSAATVRQQQMLRLQKQQQQQQQQQDVDVRARDAQVSAGVTEDRNWVNENWDSDED